MWSGFDRKARRAPLGKACCEAPHRIAVATERMHRLVGQDAVGAAAIGNDLPVGQKFCKPCFECVEIDVDSARQVPSVVLVGRAYVEERDGVVA
jgi:hypothetical protein